MIAHISFSDHLYEAILEQCETIIPYTIHSLNATINCLNSENRRKNPCE